MKYDNGMFERAENEIKRRKLSAENGARLRNDEIDERFPEIKEIKAMLARTSVELSKLILSKKDIKDGLERLKEQNLQGQRMITEILVKNGYKEDYLETKRFCAKCGDSGVNGGVRCSCFTKLLGKYALEALNNSANMPSCDIEKFSLEYYRQNPDEYKKMSDIFEYIKIYAKKFSTKSESLFFFGKTGLGKTHLSLSIAKEAAKKGYAAAYGSVQNYLRIIEKEHFGRAVDSGGDSLGLLINSDLLVLDDLGSEFHTGFYESALYNIINSRINLGLPTIINSNLNIGELLKIYDGRIISRISAMYEPFEFVGTDIRQMKRFNI